MNKHIDFLQKAIEKTRTMDDVEKLYFNSVSLHHERVSVEKITFGIERVPALLLVDYNHPFTSRIDYLLNVGNRKDFIIKILQNLVDVSLKLESHGYGQEGMLTFSRGRFTFCIDGFANENGLTHRVYIYEGKHIIKIKVIPYKERYKGEDFAGVVKELERECLDMNGFSSLPSRTRDWLMELDEPETENVC